MTQLARRLGAPVVAPSAAGQDRLLDVRRSNSYVFELDGLPNRLISIGAAANARLTPRGSLDGDTLTRTMVRGHRAVEVEDKDAGFIFHWAEGGVTWIALFPGVSARSAKRTLDGFVVYRP